MEHDAQAMALYRRCGVLTRNEVRASLGLAALPGGDELLDLARLPWHRRLRMRWRRLWRR